MAAKLRDSGFKDDQLEELGRSLRAGRRRSVVEIAGDAVDTAKSLAQALGSTKVVVEEVESSVADLFAAEKAPEPEPEAAAATAAT